MRLKHRPISVTRTLHNRIHRVGDIVPPAKTAICKKVHLIQEVRVYTGSRFEETGSMYKSFPKIFLGLALGTASLATVTLSGCHKDVEPASIPDNSGPDPADANMAPVSGNQPAPAQQPAPARVLGIRSQSTPEQSSEQYPQQ